MGVVGSIYCITNNITGKQYVGLTTKSIEARFSQHVALAAKEPKSYLHKALIKYGVENFCIKVLETNIGCFDALKAKEVEYITKLDTYCNGYNLTLGGEGTLGNILSDETKKKISVANKGNKHTKEAKLKISKALVGNKRSDPSIFKRINKEKIDKAEYEFIHPLHGRVVTYPHKLAKTYGLQTSSVHKLAVGEYKSTKGWTIQGNFKPTRGRIYELFNSTTEECICGTRKQLAEACNLSINSVDKLIRDVTKQTRLGWEFKKEIVYE